MIPTHFVTIKAIKSRCLSSMLSRRFFTCRRVLAGQRVPKIVETLEVGSNDSSQPQTSAWLSFLAKHYKNIQHCINLQKTSASPLKGRFTASSSGRALQNTLRHLLLPPIKASKHVVNPAVCSLPSSNHGFSHQPWPKRQGDASFSINKSRFVN